MSKRGADDINTDPADTSVKKAAIDPTTTILHLSTVYDAAEYPVVLVYTKQVPLTPEQVKMLANSSPSTRDKSGFSIPGYNQADDSFDPAIWSKIDLETVGVIHTTMNTTNIYAWIDE